MDVRPQRAARALGARRRRRGAIAAPRRVIAALVVALALAGLLPALAAAQTPKRPADPDRPPAGYALSANRAIAAAERSPRVRAELRPELAPTAYTLGGGRWQVSWFRDRDEVVQARLDDRSARVLEVWTGPQVAWQMARGYDGAFGRRVTEPYVWLPLCLLFLLPFVDPRRPFRLVHLDLLVLLAFSVSHVFFGRALIFASVPLAYPVLAYLLVRTLLAGLRPRRRDGPLVPFVTPTVLVLGLVFLVSFRLALDVVNGNVIDVGYAGVIGADRVVDGVPLYEGTFPADNRHGDTYGPAAYLAYVPFEQALPWSGRWDALPAARVAAAFFDVATTVGLLLLGPRLRPGPEGRRLGLVAAYAWAAYPYTAFVLLSNSGDALVSLLTVLALLALGRPALRGALLGVAGLTKLAPLALVPLMAGGTGERRWRSIAWFGPAFVITVVGLVWPFVPDGGLAELYARTMGNQVARQSPFSIWGQYPALKPLQIALGLAIVGLGTAACFLPSRRTPLQVAALGAAILVALQLATTHWFYLYVVWFAPLALLALLGEHERVFAGSPMAAQAQPSSSSSGSIEMARPSSPASTTTPFSHTSSSAVSKRAGS